MWEYLTNMINMQDLIIGGIGMIGGFLMMAIKSILNKMAANTTNAIYKRVLSKAEKVTISVLHTTEETIMKEARLALKDGKITKEEFREIGSKAKTAAVNSIIKQIGDPLKEVMDDSIREVKVFLSKLIEEKVDEVKKS